LVSDLRERAWAAAAAVVDPEIPVLTIADLGVLRDVSVAGGQVEVVITPTYSGCPAMRAIALDVQAALAEIGIDNARVRTVLAPAWTTAWMSEEGKRKLREYGIAPPLPATQPACPLCGSAETEMLSAFGSTSCKALWRCRTCKEPFDHFRCH
jgi:ring-1,2-phenylacetyl-CoA epoxidase subunit PaaD